MRVLLVGTIDFVLNRTWGNTPIIPAKPADRTSVSIDLLGIMSIGRLGAGGTTALAPLAPARDAVQVTAIGQLNGDALSDWARLSPSAHSLPRIQIHDCISSEGPRLFRHQGNDLRNRSVRLFAAANFTNPGIGNAAR